MEDKKSCDNHTTPVSKNNEKSDSAETPIADESKMNNQSVPVASFSYADTGKPPLKMMRRRTQKSPNVVKDLITPLVLETETGPSRPSVY